MPPAVPWLLEATLERVRSALEATGVTTVAVLLPGVGSAVVLVPAAVLVSVPLVAVTVTLTKSVRVWPIARLLTTALALEPAMVTVAPFGLEIAPRLMPALSTSVIVTFCAVLGPRLTSVTV